MPTRESTHTVAEHFLGRDPAVGKTYRALLTMARTLGPVTEEAKKTSIHLVARTAFAGVATRKLFLILTLKSTTDIKSRRIFKREQASANRWHLEIKLEEPSDVDIELREWIKASYLIAS